MSKQVPTQHLSAEGLQAFLEGELPAGERARAEEHLASCAHCTAEIDLWRTVFQSLDDLPTLVPSEPFAERVMAGVVAPEPLSLVARVRGRLGLPAGVGHLAQERLQDFAEGTLPIPQAARVRTHLDGCPTCAGQADAWRATFAALERLERLAPADGFADRVMARVGVPAPVAARTPEWRRALGWVAALVPQTRQAWATVSGVALTPAVTLGLVLWTVFSHPTLTAGALASFAWWKVSELAAAAWQATASVALESAGLFEVYSFFGSLALSPMALAGAFLALSAGTVAATWVLYRNLFVSHPLDGRVAHAVFS